MTKMKITYIFILLLFSFSIEDSNTIVYELNDFFNIILQAEISEDTAKKIINDLKEKLERYVYLDILKAPPQPSKGYHTTVDLIKELNNVNTAKRSLYNFYRDIKIIIDKCQDFHLKVDMSGKFESEITLQNSFFISPISYLIIDNAVHAYFNPNANGYFDNTLIYKILENRDKKIISIDGLDPLNYIQNFNGDFNKFKSPQAQFVYNQYNSPLFKVSSFPFNKDKLTDITIKYENYDTLTFSYKVLQDKNKAELLNKYFDNPLTQNNNLEYKLPFLQRNLKVEELSDEQKLKTVDWDSVFETDAIKCKVDSTNEMNVFLQQRFDVSDVQKGIKFIDSCFDKFGNNKYPIMIIENYNAGGKIELSNHLLSYVNIKKIVPIYGSMRYNDQVKTDIAPKIEVKKIEQCDIIRADEFWKSNPKEDIYTNESGQNIYHKRTEIFDLSVFSKKVFHNYRKSKKLKDPTDIIIFTDGFSNSATSIFIKETQLKGGSIIAGFGGSPNIHNFDSSQSAACVKNISILSDDLGFSLSYTFIEIFNKTDIESGNKIPLEFQINPIDERAYIFNQYYDGSYDEFIQYSKFCFDKYKTKCNINNKKLLKISEECEFNDTHMHGGYECGDNGIWSEKCVPSYCDNGYYFDDVNQLCKEYTCDDSNYPNSQEGKKINLIYLVISLIFLLDLF